MKCYVFMKMSREKGYVIYLTSQDNDFWRVQDIIGFRYDPCGYMAVSEFDSCLQRWSGISLSRRPL